MPWNEIEFANYTHAKINIHESGNIYYWTLTGVSHYKSSAYNVRFSTTFFDQKVYTSLWGNKKEVEKPNSIVTLVWMERSLASPTVVDYITIVCFLLLFRFANRFAFTRMCITVFDGGVSSVFLNSDFDVGSFISLDFTIFWTQRQVSVVTFDFKGKERYIWT